MNPNELTDQPSWYVIYTLPRQESRAADNLMTLGIQILAPKMKRQRCHPFTGELMQDIRPLFPRYIFACFSLRALLNKVRYTRGVHSIVKFGDRAAPVADDIISVLRSRMTESGFVRMGEKLSPGDEVVVKDGLLKDFLGVFERELKDNQRVMILLQSVSYQVHLRVERELVRKVERPA